MAGNKMAASMDIMNIMNDGEVMAILKEIMSDINGGK